MKGYFSQLHCVAAGQGKLVRQEKLDMGRPDVLRGQRIDTLCITGLLHLEHREASGLLAMLRNSIGCFSKVIPRTTAALPMECLVSEILDERTERLYLLISLKMNSYDELAEVSAELHTILFQKYLWALEGNKTNTK